MDSNFARPWKCDISHRFPCTDSKYWWRHRITDDRVWKARMPDEDRRCACSMQRLCARMVPWRAKRGSRKAGRFHLVRPVFPPSLTGPPPSRGKEWRALTSEESITTIDKMTNECLQQVRAGIDGVLVLLDHESERSEGCFSALCLLGMVKAQLDGLLAERERML
ncbi:DUF1484 family protein [Cupriavidus necator]|uniref:DUF1484 family protein n=2 Tax=Cupriavidus necator TaxID=106590 RepID=Q0K1X8_CUPNH|nr:DUF1484 family protein [Cupriavidus necator]WKA45229.1 DUF1484 family protein [Cupriavidus necator]CAJ95996.1 Hypothetical protein H16_B1206 [Cupriavidus necator H16]